MQTKLLAVGSSLEHLSMKNFFRSDLPYVRVLALKLDKERVLEGNVNKGNKYFVTGAVDSFEYSNILYLHLIIGKAHKFVSGDKNDF